MDEFHPVLARMRIAALQSEYVLPPPPLRLCLWSREMCADEAVLEYCRGTRRQMALCAFSAAKSLL